MVQDSKKSKRIQLLHELLKDSSRSDRELSKAMGVSQPTVSKLKRTLVKEDLIRGFTIIPNYSKMGYNLLAFTFVKIKPLLSSSEERQRGHDFVKEWMCNQPNVVFSHYCRGMDMDGFMISFHQSYRDFDKFVKKHNEEIGHLLNDVQNILVNLAGEETLKEFHFRYLADNFDNEK